MPRPPVSARPERLALQAVNRIEELARLSDPLDEFLDRADADAETRHAVRFALEELFSNIVNYAYDDERSHRIEIELSAGQDGLALTLEDDGRAFDPGTAAPPDTTSPLDERPIGGLGLFLLRRLASGMAYQRIGGRNRTTVWFRRLPGG